MKILIIRGDDDYAALTFEQEHLEKGETIQSVIERVEAGEDISAGSDFEATVMIFGDVDTKFMDWVKKEMMDYDQSKHENFYYVPFTKV